MKRILLVTEREPDFGTSTCVEQLLTGLSGDYDFAHLRLYPGGLAAQIGLVARLRSAGQPAHLVHAFGYRAMQVATLLLNAPILYTPLADDPVRAIRWTRAAMSRRDLRLLSLSSGEDRPFVSGGFPSERSHLLRPGVRLGRTLAPDHATRQSLGLAPDDIALLAVGESLPTSNHLMVLHTLSILNAISPRWRMLFWGAGPQADKVKQLNEDWGTRLIIDARELLGRDVPFTQVLLAANLAMVAAPERVSIAPILACMAHGLPIVAPATRAVSDTLEDRHNALLYSPVKARAAAQRLLTLSEDTRLQRQLADQVRADAYELYSVSRFLDSVRQIYG